MTLAFESVDEIQMKALCLYFHRMLLFLTILENEIWKFGRNLPLATFGSERVNKLYSLIFETKAAFL